jgi:predicted RNA polymerase sigma factor
MLHCEARRPARRSAEGKFVPLSEQDPRSWLTPLIEEAERELMAAARNARLGRFQLEAAIQSVHAERAHSGRTDWRAIARFYDQLVQVAPSLGAAVGHAAAHAEAMSAAAGLALLDEIDSDSVTSYQPYWAVRAHLLSELGRKHDAQEAFDRAIGLSEDDAVRAFLLRRRSAQ